MNFKDLIYEIDADLQAGWWSSANEKWGLLPPEIQQSISGQLLHCRWLIGTEKAPEAFQFLKKINPSEGSKEDQSTLQRLKNKASKAPVSSTRSFPPSILRKREQLIKLIQKGGKTTVEASFLLKTIVRNREFNHLVAHKLLQDLKDHTPTWPLLIQDLFPVTSRINPKPLIAWKTWLRDCPTDFRKGLLAAMREHLQTHPDYRMESWLERQPSIQ